MLSKPRPASTLLFRPSEGRRNSGFRGGGSARRLVVGSLTVGNRSGMQSPIRSRQRDRPGGQVGQGPTDSRQNHTSSSIRRVGSLGWPAREGESTVPRRPASHRSARHVRRWPAALDGEDPGVLALARHSVRRELMRVPSASGGRTRSGSTGNPNCSTRRSCRRCLRGWHGALPAPTSPCGRAGRW